MVGDDFAVLGLDLSLTATGIAPWGEEPYTLKFGKGRGIPQGDQRLHAIRNMIQGHVLDLEKRGWYYDLAVIEGLPPYGKASASLGLVHGVAREILAYCYVPVVMLSPASLKKWVTGNGKASKEDMALQFNAVSQWTEGKFDDNAVDAYWLQQVGLKRFGGQYVAGQFDVDYDVTQMLKVVK